MSIPHYVEAEKVICSAAKLKDDVGKDIEKEIVIKVGDKRRVLDLKDQDSDPIQVSERLCKGLWFRMGYAGTVNGPSFNKSNLSMSYKFLVHSVIHALCHRKGGYDVSIDYIMCILTCLILNRPYNISQVIFNHTVENVKGEKFLQYPRFLQMLLDDQSKNLPKVESDELVLEHMDNETLKRLQVYKGKDEKMNDKWRHDNSDSGTEDEKMSLFVNKRSKWWLKDDDKQKKKKISKAATERTPKKTTTKPHLVDEPSDDDVPRGGENVEGGEAGSS
ncbi:hypothetical protein Hanom_Chr09g00787391 [Helianthus anomalus]